MNDVTIKIHEDWAEMVRADLAALGYPVDPAADDLKLFCKLQNAKLRDVEMRPRKVLRASSLVVPAEHQAAFDAIEEKARKGESLTPHLSKKLLDVDYEDGLLHDWGIHHLHLSTITDATNSRFVERTGPVLFARITPSRFLGIAIFEHGSWADLSLIETILTNWPEELEPYELRGIPARQMLSHEERKMIERERTKARKCLNVLVEINGKVYAPLGGGVNSAGSNVRFVSLYDRICDELNMLKNLMTTDLEAFRRALPQGHRFGGHPEFRLKKREGRPFLYETTSETFFDVKITE